jgi:hypothetical protein
VLKRAAQAALGWLTGLSLAVRIALGAGALLLAGVLVWWLFLRPSQLKAEAVNARADATVAKGEAAKGADARQIQEKTHEIIRTIERQTIINERTIRAAPGAGQPMAPDVARAGRAALCLRHAYRGDPACQQLPGADPAGVAGTDAGRQPAAG